MPVYHIVLLKLKPGITDADWAPMKADIAALVGVVPGLQSVCVGSPMPISADRNHGFNLAVVAMMDNTETVSLYANHPAHVALMHYKEELSVETLAYDFEF